MRIRQSKTDIVFSTVNTIVLIIICLLMIYPLYFILIASFSDPNRVNAGQVLFFPKDITLLGYQRVFRQEQLWIGYRNTILYLILGTFISVFCTLTGGYALSRKDLKGRKFFMTLFIITMFFNGGLIPRYLLVNGLGLTDTIWSLVLPNAISIWNLIITRTFFESTIPDELLDAARVDGCGTLRFFFQIVLPLSSAVTMVLILFYGVGIWNSYFDAMIFIKRSQLQPLQLVLRDILLINQTSNTMISDVREAMQRQKTAELLKYVIIIISSLPLLIVYPFIQKYFEEGVMVGSVKG